MAATGTGGGAKSDHQGATQQLNFTLGRGGSGRGGGEGGAVGEYAYDDDGLMVRTELGRFSSSVRCSIFIDLVFYILRSHSSNRLF